MFRSLVVVALFILIVFNACKKQVEFDKEALLEDLAQDYVVASYESLLLATNNLKTASETFVTSPTSATLSKTQDAWRETMDAWSVVEGLNFGPGQDFYRYLQIDNTPVRAASIEKSILGNTPIDLSYLQKRGSYTKGLATVEYLLFDPTNGNAAVLQAYQMGPTNARRLAYLNYSVQHVLELMQSVSDDWKNDYAAELAKLTDNSSTGGIARFSNVMLHLTQTLARKKVGKPLGKESRSGQVQPQLVESPYAVYSWPMIHHNLRGLQQIFGDENKGMGSYLKHLLDDGKNTEKIAAQLERVVELTRQRSYCLEQELQVQPAEVEVVFEELKTLYIYLEEDYLPYVSVALLANPDDGD